MNLYYAIFFVIFRSKNFLRNVEQLNVKLWFKIHDIIDIFG